MLDDGAALAADAAVDNRHPADERAAFQRDVALDDGDVAFDAPGDVGLPVYDDEIVVNGAADQRVALDDDDGIDAFAGRQGIRAVRPQHEAAVIAVIGGSGDGQHGDADDAGRERGQPDRFPSH